MYATTDCRAAIDAFNVATRAFEETIRAPEGGRPPYAEIARLCAEMNAAQAEAAAAVPETIHDAAAKLELAAKDILGGAFDGDGDMLAQQARAIAADLVKGRQGPAIVARLEQLIADSEESALAFWRIHGFTCSGLGLEHLRSTLAGLNRPPLVAATVLN